MSDGDSDSEKALHLTLYPVRNNAPLGFESQRLEFLTGFTLRYH